MSWLPAVRHHRSNRRSGCSWISSNAAAAAGVENFLYVSIVGIDEISYSYYEHKLAAEAAVEQSTVPSTIVRATQFHSFLDEMLGMGRWLPIWPLPKEMQFQPIAVEEAAAAMVEHAEPEAGGRVPVVGGPELLTLGELATTYRKARGMRRLAVNLPLPSQTVREFEEGNGLCPDRRIGTTTWEEFLAERYGAGPTDTPGQSTSPS